MHGTVVWQMKNFVNQKLGEGRWDDVLKQADLTGRTYLAHKEYPDEEVVAMVRAASELSDVPVPEILKSFGEFLVPYLAETFRFLIKEDWAAIDLIQNTEDSIHKVIRSQDPNARPPALKCERISPQEVVITYSSPRRMCDVAKGIVTGIAVLFNEELSISESQCMHQGAAHCLISVKNL